MSAIADLDLEIKPGQWREVALSDEEYERIVALLGRTPTIVELGMFGAMWSEHCGYKHSRPLLKTLPTEAPWVLQGPGENAGAIDVGDGLAIVFKIESHNHPSAVEPREGAATGVGGIVRDIFTMGARPIALLNSLRFGPLDEPRNRYLATNVVAGIGGYGNCLGIPTVGGELFFDASFNGNPLVNAMCIGVTAHDAIMRAEAAGPGNVIMLIGAETGRDGLHGATFASVEDPESSHRGVIQVGNPFLEKLLLEACLELLQGGEVVAMQDLGAAGLTSSAVECASRGGVGAEIDVALVPRRETGMSAYEVMLSESQERMLLVVRPDGVKRVNEIVAKWGLHSAAIGTVTDDGRVRVLDSGNVVVDVPAELFTDACPTYRRTAAESHEIESAREESLGGLPDLDSSQIGSTLLDLLSSPNIGSRRPVYSQYDHTIMTNTVVGPGPADAAVVRLKGTSRAIAAATDCNSRYCYLDPELGAALAVAEATRNVACVGGQPLAITNCLNFGSPLKPSGMYQLERAVAGIAHACQELGVPVVSGNVSLYNETADAAVMPTPTIGAVGVLEDATRVARAIWREGDQIAVLGSSSSTIGGSEFLARMHGKTAGHPPDLDLELEKRLQTVLVAAIGAGELRTAHDCAEGGLAVALAELAINSGIGFRVSLTTETRVDERWFGESASRVVVAGEPEELLRLQQRCADAGIPFMELGVSGGECLLLGEEIRVDLTAARDAFEHALSLMITS